MIDPLLIPALVVLSLMSFRQLPPCPRLSLDLLSDLRSSSGGASSAPLGSSGAGFWTVERI